MSGYGFETTTDEILADHDAIDVPVNNAGIMCCPLGRTADGFEMQFGTNHLGHFLLTNRLLPALLRGLAPRIVNLSSGGHAIADVGLDDPKYESTPYDPWEAHGRSKTANVLFTVELAQRLGRRGALCFAVHPGAIGTGLGRHLTPETIEQMTQRTRQRSNDAGGRVESAGCASRPWRPARRRRSGLRRRRNSPRTMARISAIASSGSRGPIPPVAATLPGRATRTRRAGSGR